MGRNTWESLPIKPLPERRNIVITKKTLKGVECFKSIKDAVRTCEGDIWFIGGAGIYEEAMKKADKIDMTLVPDNVDGKGCIYFPKIGKEWEEKEIQMFENEPKLKRKIYTRRV